MRIGLKSKSWQGFEVKLSLFSRDHRQNKYKKKIEYYLPTRKDGLE